MIISCIIARVARAAKKAQHALQQAGSGFGSSCMMAAAGHRLSSAERRYIEQGVGAGVRSDGRGCLDYRHMTIQCGILPQANGSARVQVVNGSTDIIGAVKAEIGEPLPEWPSRGRIEVSVECWTRLPPQFAGRRAADVDADLSNSLSRVLATSGAIDLDKLCVIPGKQCWVLYLDLLVLDTGGTLMDGLSLAAYAALNNARLPKLHVVRVGMHDDVNAEETPAAVAAVAAEGDVGSSGGGDGSGVVATEEDDVEFDIEVDDDPAHAVAIDASGVPVCITFARIGHHSVVDARQSEELCSSSRMMVFVSRTGAICAVETSGTGAVSTAALHKALADAARIAGGLIAQVDRALLADAARQQQQQQDELVQLASKRLTGPTSSGAAVAAGGVGSDGDEDGDGDGDDVAMGAGVGM